SAAGITVGAVNINGAFTARIDGNDNQSGSTLTAASLRAASVTLEGGSDDNDRINVATITSTSGGVTLANDLSLTRSTTIDSAGSVAFNGAVGSTANSTLTVNNTGTWTVGGDLALGGALTQAGGN